MKQIYWIAESNLFTLKNELARLNRRAAKIGAASITLVQLAGVKSQERRNEITNEVVSVERFLEHELSGETPKFAGWSLAAVIEHAEEGNILRKVPGCTVELPKYRQGLPVCEHCQLARRRNETFVVVHDDGTQKQVGRDCIKDFLGHTDPHAFARMSEILFSAGELCGGAEDSDFFGEGGSRAKEMLYVQTFLNYAACACRKLGYISGKREYESMGAVRSTKSTALCWMNPTPKMMLNKHYFRPEDSDVARAAVAHEYVLDTLSAKQPEKLTDFEHNLLTAAKCEVVDYKSAGILAFIVEYYSREMEKAKIAADEVYFGEPKARVRNQPIVFIKSTGFDTQFGHTFIYSFSVPAVPGARLVWMTGTEIDMAPGAEVLATFTVKAHEEYNGHKQTKISRLVYEIAEAAAA